MAYKQGLHYVDLDPNVEQSQDQTNHFLRIHLPGFKKEELRAQVDGSGKLTVRGQRPLANGRFERLNKALQLPPDSDFNKIRGKFEGEHLSLVCPKKATPDKKEQLAPQKLEPKADEKKEKEEAPRPKEGPKPSGKKEGAAIKPKQEQTEEATPAAKKGPMNGTRSEAEATPTDKEGPDSWKLKQRSSAIDADQILKSREKRLNWRHRIAKESEGWPDCRLAINNLVDTIYKNKKVIAVAIAAFSLGFFVSHKLRSRD